ncbi:HAMP domain-containing sensor histidine kinase [Peptostreptococcus stomatis]|uniref:sensor histidine kinase n=1 Tax=Peptostreptococcus stomatis TaxID=341694 RepID=UPI0028E82064|nr:HAMP domain-containing sensor histidine kinase [Peptostreptococcus stomatis]
MKIKKAYLLIVLLNLVLSLGVFFVSPRLDVITLFLFILVNTLIFLLLILSERRRKAQLNKEIDSIFTLLHSLDIDTDEYELEDDEFGKLRDEIIKVILENKIIADKAKENKETLREYTEDIAHQLKTPLTGILLMLDLIEDDEENKKEYLGHIRSNTNRLHQLVDILLKLAALDSGTIKMKKDIVNIKDLVGEIVTEMEILFADRGSTTLIIGENFDLVCDRKWTYEAIYNVVKNGIESSPKEGVRIILKETNIYKSIIVEDYSQGIPDEVLKKVYKRFYKENQNSKGYGIGLPMAKTIVEKQNGELIYTRGKTSNYFEFRFYI